MIIKPLITSLHRICNRIRTPFGRLKRISPKWRKRLVLAGFLIFLFILFYNSLPDPLFSDPYSMVLYDQNRDLLGACISEDEQWRFPAPETVPDKFKKAVTEYEDRRFFRHPGVDALAMIRAVRQNARAGEIISGGSTITMQVLRLARKGKPRTVWEKLIESILALRLELTHSKQDILKLYTAHAPFGGNVVGLEAACWRYFGRSPEQLSWAETAALAVLPNSPALIHPARNRNLLKIKRDHLLERLWGKGVMDSLTCRLAQSEPLPSQPVPIPMFAPHLLQRLRDRIPALPENKRTAASRVISTLDRRLQIRAAEILEQHRRRLAANGVHNACALIIDVRTGAVLAYIGNGAQDSESHGNWVDIITAPRSTGSILKPFLYAAMMQSGDILPATLIPDIPTRLSGFAPENFDKTFQGAVPASMALARSLNIPAVRMLHQYGLDKFHFFLKQCGMTTLFRPANGYGLSLILGGAEGTLWEITGIYACMARSLLFFNSEVDRGRNPFFMPVLRSGKTESTSLYPPLNPGACWLTIQAMQEVIRPGDEAVWREFGSSRKVAWKTGTSYGFRDAWAVGLTSGYAVGVWAGNADGEGRPQLTGIRAAAPILFDLFNSLPRTEWFQKPEPDLIRIEVCRKSGYRRGPHCDESPGIDTVPQGRRVAVCPYCQQINLDKTGQFRADSRVENVADLQPQDWFVLPPVMEWYYKKHHSDYRTLPPFKQTSGSMSGDQPQCSLSIIYPDPGGVIYVPVELSGERGRTVFEAAHRHPLSIIYWHLNDQYLGETREIHKMPLAPKPGEHILTLIDEYGEMVRRSFTVLSN